MTDLTAPLPAPPAPEPAGLAAPPPGATPRPPRLRPLRDIGSGIAAVGVKELRGRMRGKRAFVILTIHLLLVAGFAWMVESLAERTFSMGFGSSFSASSEIGRQLFIAIVLLLTLITLILAPASTAGAISLEREKQTLDLLTTTPISSLAIVLGKLLSALSWILLLLLASIPVVALVFTFGGVAPDDVLRAYAILLGTAFAYGAIGLFVSALVRRTQAATVINLVAVIFLTAGTAFVFLFWTAMAGNQGFLPDQPQARDRGPLESLTRRPPEALMWFNPFVAQVDVLCGTETGFGASCQIVAAVTDQQALFNGNVGGEFGVVRDTYWPRSVAAMLAASVLLIVLSVQLVSPTRRWRIRLPRPRRRPAGSEAP
jgi:ABC-type transport system involved in multi-copper enzyme maturation permease subunit